MMEKGERESREVANDAANKRKRKQKKKTTTTTKKAIIKKYKSNKINNKIKSKEATKEIDSSSSICGHPARARWTQQ